MIDNTKAEFNSAAKALNRGGRQANSKYIMFIHQDVNLSSEYWLENAEKTLDSLPSLGIAGVAGAKNSTGVITNIKHGNPPTLAGNTQIEGPENVQTLDECLVIIPKKIFDKLQFDELVCDDWHLYAVDYCLSAKLLGLYAYVLPCYLYHRSSGYSFSERYFFSLEKLLQKHKYSYNYIYTTNGNWDAQNPITIKKIRINYYAKIIINFFEHIRSIAR